MECGECMPANVQWRPASYALSAEDVPIILASVSIYCACIAQGICISVVTTSQRQMAQTAEVEVADIGTVVFAGGVGFMLGCLLFTLLLDVLDAPKHYLCCAASMIGGLFTFLLVQTTSYSLMALFVLMQMVGLGGVLLFATLSMLEMWGQRVQPWMQMKASSCGLGLVAGPVMAAHWGYRAACLWASLLCVTPLLVILLLLGWQVWQMQGQQHGLERGWGLELSSSSSSSSKDTDDTCLVLTPSPTSTLTPPHSPTHSPTPTPKPLPTPAPTPLPPPTSPLTPTPTTTSVRDILYGGARSVYVAPEIIQIERGMRRAVRERSASVPYNQSSYGTVSLSPIQHRSRAASLGMGHLMVRQGWQQQQQKQQQQQGWGQVGQQQQQEEKQQQGWAEEGETGTAGTEKGTGESGTTGGGGEMGGEGVTNPHPTSPHPSPDNRGRCFSVSDYLESQDRDNDLEMGEGGEGGSDPDVFTPLIPTYSLQGQSQGRQGQFTPPRSQRSGRSRTLSPVIREQGCRGGEQNREPGNRGRSRSVSFAKKPGNKKENREFGNRESGNREQGNTSSRTLSFATPKIVANLVLLRETGIVLVPFAFRGILVVSMGLFHCYMDFVGCYAQLRGVVREGGMAAELNFEYYCWMTLGCCVSVPASLFFSNTTLARTHIGIAAVGAAVLCTGGGLLRLRVATALISYGESCLMALSLGLAIDYGFTLDTKATTTLLISATAGDCFAPILMWQLVRCFGAAGFPPFIAVLVGVMVLSCWSLHLQYQHQYAYR